jgi:primosomal protein N'
LKKADGRNKYRMTNIITGLADIQNGKYQLMVVNNVDGTSNIPQFRSENYYFPITIQRTGNNRKLLEDPGY